MENELRVYHIEVVATEPYVDTKLLRWLLETDGVDINYIEEQ